MPKKRETLACWLYHTCGHRLFAIEYRPDCATWRDHHGEHTTCPGCGAELPGSIADAVLSGGWSEGKAK
jgi:hypothetical protein